MAAGGKSFSGSVKESDYYYDFYCSPCEQNGRNVEAIKHCADCDENLCSTCLTHHNKFAMMRGHKLLDQVQTSQEQTKQLPSQRCSKHGGKIIDVFCPEHDAVGCSTCIYVDHSSCKGKQFIPDVAVGIKKSREVKELETEMETLDAKLDSLKIQIGNNLQRLKRDKCILKKEIEFFRKKMNEQLDKMEKALVEETERKFKQKINAIHEHIAEVDGILGKVKHAMGEMKSDNNDVDLFVSCKIVKQQMTKELYPLHAKVEERLPEHSLELQIDDTTKLIMEGKLMLASIKDTLIVQKAEYKKDINIRTSDDKKLSRVYGICALPDGCLVMSDNDNKKLKRLNPASNKVSTLIKLPDNPFGICLVDNTRLAVSLINQKKIQFVSLSGLVTLGSNFTVGDRCRGLAYCDGLLYVCCGGCTELAEGRGHVEVYTCTGELIRCLYEEFQWPEYITVISGGYSTAMYLSDSYKIVQVRSKYDTIEHRFTTVHNTNLPFCLIGTDQLCIGEYAIGNIYIQTCKGKSILIQKKDVNGMPVCLYFDEKSSRLFVALQDYNAIKVFDLKIE